MEAPEYFQGTFCQQFSSETKTPPGAAVADHFIVEDLLDFSNDDAMIITDPTFDSLPRNSTDSSTLNAVDSCNSSSFSGCHPNFVADIGSRNLLDANFSSDLCVPV